jgi:hypothetical protein
MNTETLPRRLVVDAAGGLAGLVVVVLLGTLVGNQLFTRLFEQGPLAITIAFPGAVAVGAGVAVATRRLLRGEVPAVTATAAALAAAGGAHLTAGGIVGVYVDVANSSFQDLLLATTIGLAAGVVAGTGVYRHLSAPEDRPTAVRSVVGLLVGLVAGLGGAVVLFVALTTALDPYIWPATLLTLPVAIVAGLVFAVVSYRLVVRWRADEER